MEQQSTIQKSIYSAFAQKPMNLEELNSTNELIAAHELL
jgi:hypothetical protein